VLRHFCALVLPGVALLMSLSAPVPARAAEGASSSSRADARGVLMINAYNVGYE